MLLQLADPGLLLRDPVAFFVNLILGLAIVGPAILVGITIHEFSHAVAASYLGDSTAKRLGRISLNPLRHLEPVGTLFILIFGFGWGKPVPVNAYYLRGGMVKGMALVSFAGPLSNIIVATLAAMAIRFGLIGRLMSGPVELELFLLRLVGVMIAINLILAVFNMLPIAPLDGFKVAVGILPRDLAIPLARTEQYGMAILLMLVVVDQMFRVGILSFILGPVVSGISRLLLGF